MEMAHSLGTIAYHRGFMIVHDMENGRRFYSTTVPDPSGWSLKQEFGSVQDARDWIDGKIASNIDYFRERDPLKLHDRRFVGDAASELRLRDAGLRSHAEEVAAWQETQAWEN